MQLCVHKHYSEVQSHKFSRVFYFKIIVLVGFGFLFYVLCLTKKLKVLFLQLMGTLIRTCNVKFSF